ncbi:MAG: metal-dependent hydrolase [Dehalococcoidia bacterium]|nr:metal-dependent hydrolase [Dehalococcoidia bacterium]
MAVKVKWLSHAAFMITSPQGKVIITDPFFEGNPLCPIKVADIKAADLVLVSHDHADHVGNAVDIAKKTGAIVCAAPETGVRLQQELGLPAQNAAYGAGINIGGSIVVKGVTVTMTQAFHSSPTGCCAGYIIKLEDGTTIYHAGDTGIFSSMQLLGEMYKIDLALLPIGGVYTMDSAQAARALKLLDAKVAIPMHFKTWPLLEQDAKRFVELAKKEAPKTKVVVLEPGQEHTL